MNELRERYETLRIARSLAYERWTALVIEVARSDLAKRLERDIALETLTLIRKDTNAAWLAYVDSM